MHKNKTIYDLGDQQRAILEIVWAAGRATVREVWERLSADRPLAYTSVLSVMQKLEKSGWLRHESEGRCYVYRAACDRHESTLTALNKFVDRVYDGDPAGLLGQLYGQAGRVGRARPSLRTLVDFRRSAA